MESKEEIVNRYEDFEVFYGKFMEAFSDSLFEEFRNNYKKSDYIPTLFLDYYSPITTFLESIFNYLTGKNMHLI